MTLLNWHSATHFGTRPPRSAAANERHPLLTNFGASGHLRRRSYASKFNGLPLTDR
jgi:hypothetical protein